MRFQAEAAWYPTALLPSHSLQWKAVDDFSAQATLKDGETAVTLLFRFGQDGLIKSVRAEAHGRAVKDVVIPTPWEVQWSNYELRGGMFIPKSGSASEDKPDKVVC